MGPLRDIRLNRAGALLLAAVSLAATILILTGGSSKTDAQLAAQYALKHPLRSVDEVLASTASTSSPSDRSGGGSASSSPSTVNGGGIDSASSTSSGGGSSSAGSDDSGSGGSEDSSTTATASTTTSTTSTTTTAAPDAGLPKVGHVFLLTLSTPNYKTAFSATSAAPYLRTLAKRGTVLTGYRSLTKGGLADLLATVSGQRPNADTTAGCQTYAAFPTNAKISATGLVSTGSGCIYPDAALTIADEVNAAGKTWGAYIDDMGPNNCLVPSVGESLDTPLDGSAEGYDVAQNPFGFFGSLLDEGGCTEYDQDLATNLPSALAKKASTPNFTYLGGDACVDADPTEAPAGTDPTDTVTTTTGTTTTGAATTATSTTPATSTTTATSTTPARLTPPAGYGCPAGEPSGIAGENAFLQTWVPKILASPAYRANGVLIIDFTGANGAAHAKTGALVLSRWTPRGKRIATAYTPYSMYRSIEDMLNLQALAEGVTAPSFAKLVLR